jgi:hypothetical protein
MYLSYIDEPGKPDRNHSENEFVLAALTINEKDWQAVDNKVKLLKIKHFPTLNPDSFELHTSDIMNHEDMYKKIPLEARLRLVEDMLTIISDIDCTLTAVVIYKQKIWKPDLDVDTWALRLLFERLCWLLEDKNKPTVSSGKPVEYGILLIYSITKKYDAKIRDKILCLFRNGTYYMSNKYLIEDPLFVESKYRHLSQLVDCAAYCIRRKYRTPPRPDEQEIYDRFNRLIEDKFLKDKHGQFLGHGLKFFP